MNLKSSPPCVAFSASAAPVQPLNRCCPHRRCCRCCCCCHCCCCCCCRSSCCACCSCGLSTWTSVGGQAVWGGWQGL